MPDIFTTQLSDLDQHSTYQAYNGLDCAITLEVHEELEKIGLTPQASLTYNFVRAMQAPALDMMLRGFKVDQYYRWKVIAELEKKKALVQEILDEQATAVWDRGLNPQSPKQMKEFFYGVMKLPQQYKFAKGKRTVSTDREALEKLQLYFYAEPLINCILKLRELSKKVSVLRSEVDADGRMRTSYNVAGTETERWSSSSNVHGGGTNLQNITEELRRVFIADKGKKLAYIDLSQAESRALGFLCFTLFGKSAYLDACESGDLHTSVCKLVWRDLDWSDNNFEHNKELAEKIFYRHFTYRDMAKRGGHGTNYVGQPYTMAKHLKVKVKLIEDFQHSYFTSFPELKDYHRWAAKHIQLHGALETPLGTSRLFFGRPNDDATIREGVAYVPQHMVGVLLNLALWRVWYYLGGKVELLAQIHDAIIIQYEEEEEEEALSSVLPLMATPLTHAGRTMTIPSDVMTGWNWAKFNDGTGKGKGKPLNLDGLKGYKLGKLDSRKRSEDPEASGLDRLVS